MKFTGSVTLILLLLGIIFPYDLLSGQAPPDTLWTRFFIHREGGHFMTSSCGSGQRTEDGGFIVAGSAEGYAEQGLSARCPSLPGMQFTDPM